MTRSITPKSLKTSFLYSLLSIVFIFGFAEAMMMMLLEMFSNLGIVLIPIESTLIDVVGLTLISILPTWWLILRPWAVKFKLQHDTNIARLNENQQLLQAVNNHALVSITDLSGTITYVNDLFCKVSGYSAAELLGQNHRIVKSGHHPDEFMRDMWLNLSKGQAWQGDICNRSKLGHLYWVATTITPMFDENGEPEHYISIRHDITRLKKKGTQLTIIGTALEASTDMVFITDLQGLICYANPAFYTFTGAEPDTLIGIKPSKLDHPKADSNLLTNMRQSLSKGHSWTNRLLSQRNQFSTTSSPTDCWLNISITPIRADDGKLLGYVQIQSDITHRFNNELMQQQAQKNRANRLFFSEILQQILPLSERGKQVLTRLFSLKDFNLLSKGIIYSKNQSLNNLFPLSIIGELNNLNNSNLYEQCVAVTLNQEPNVIGHCHCDSHPEAHGHYLTPIIANGNCLGVLALVTPSKPLHNSELLTLLNQIADLFALELLKDAAQQSAEAARDTAEQASKAKSEFLANMSHEIRTPMNGVLGMLDVLHQTSLQGYQVEILEVIQDSANSLLDIIEDVLDFSKIEAGKLELEQAPVVVREVIEKSAAMLNRIAINKGVALTIYTDPELPELVQGDAARLRQIVVNFTNNAIKFSSQKADLGLVSVEALLIERHGQQAIIEIRVIDNGIGMEPATLDKLFTPFTQADASTTRRFGGTGLGLNITYNLVQLMSGSIDVKSTLGQGSTFSARLPFTVLDSPLNTEHRPSSIVGLNCLIIGDLKSQTHYFSSYLKSAGAIVSLVPDLSTAYQQSVPVEASPWIWLIANDDDIQPEEFQQVIQHPSNVDIRLVVIRDGRRKRVRQNEDSRLVHIDNNIITQQRIILAVAMAAGLMKAEPSALSLNQTRVTIEPPTREQALEQGRLILVAEDNKTNQKVIQRQLAILGFAADIATDGLEALNRWRTERYPLLLTDLHMPTMDGYELATTIRAEEDPNDPLIIIAWTASVVRSEGQNCLSAGMNDIIRKPSSQLDLKTMLEKWLPMNYKPLIQDSINNSSVETKSLPAININTLTALVGDDPEIIKDFLQDFHSSLTILTDAIKAEFDAGDIKKLGLKAHTLKSSARSMGALRLGDICNDIESTSKSSNTITDFNEYLQAFNLEVATVNSALENLLKYS